MSEFKFACPVCGQHITADSSASGTPLECPTCFQKIVVPQAPTVGDSKFILSAAQVSKPRPTSIEGTSDLGPLCRPRASNWIATGGTVLVLLCAAGAAFIWRAEILTAARKLTPLLAGKTENPSPPLTPPKPAPGNPANARWTLDVTNAVIPRTPVAGRVNGQEFVCDQPTLLGGALLLRQGESWPPEFGIGILLVAQTGEELSGKTVVVTPDQATGAPRVLVRWRGDQPQPVTKTITNGYALKVTFGKAADGRIKGKVYIALPDQAKSFAAGTFDAEIRKPEPPHRPRAQ